MTAKAFFVRLGMVFLSTCFNNYVKRTAEVASLKFTSGCYRLILPCPKVTNAFRSSRIHSSTDHYGKFSTNLTLYSGVSAVFVILKYCRLLHHRRHTFQVDNFSITKLLSLILISCGQKKKKKLAQIVVL